MRVINLTFLFVMMFGVPASALLWVAGMLERAPTHSDPEDPQEVVVNHLSFANDQALDLKIPHLILPPEIKLEGEFAFLLGETLPEEH